MSKVKRSIVSCDLHRQIILLFFLSSIVKQSSRYRQGIVNRQSSIVNRQARGPGSLMSKKVDSVQKSGQSDLKRGHVQNIGRQYGLKSIHVQNIGQFAVWPWIGQR
jgi:hypothetical protein